MERETAAERVTDERDLRGGRRFADQREMGFDGILPEVAKMATGTMTGKVRGVELGLGRQKLPEWVEISAFSREAMQ
jgi:hypothetical protein